MLLQRESKFEGSVLGFIGYGLILVIITICTFGIAYPWGEVMFRRWICRNTIIDGQRLTFDGTQVCSSSAATSNGGSSLSSRWASMASGCSTR